MTRKKASAEGAGLVAPPPGTGRGTEFGAESGEPVALPGPTANDSARAVAPPPGDQHYPVADVLRNNSEAEFACRQTGLLLSPGASRLVTIRDAAHLAQLLDVVARFNDAQLRPGRLKFDRIAG